MTDPIFQVLVALGAMTLALALALVAALVGDALWGDDDE
jgi:hypothetical protein